MHIACGCSSASAAVEGTAERGPQKREGQRRLPGISLPLSWAGRDHPFGPGECLSASNVCPLPSTASFLSNTQRNLLINVRADHGKN